MSRKPKASPGRKRQIGRIVPADERAILDERELRQMPLIEVTHKQYVRIQGKLKREGRPRRSIIKSANFSDLTRKRRLSRNRVERYFYWVGDKRRNEGTIKDRK